LRQVHPHARGEDLLSTLVPIPSFGSSRRAWGRQHQKRHHIHGLRFIPTRVGKTYDELVLDGVSAVHPHARGEDATRNSNSINPVGSSPRAWGRLTRHHTPLTARRFIPTRVGKTVGVITGMVKHPVHPHARGEDLSISNIDFDRNGSSPRAWGRR